MTLVAVFIFSICLVSIPSGHLYGQNNALVLNGAYIKLSGGTAAIPIYLVVGQSNALGITRTSGHIISEGDYNFVKWNQGAATGSYVYPFGYSTTDYLPLTFNKTAGNANLAVSSYYPTTTPTANLPLANAVANMNPSGPSSDASNMVVDRWWRLQVENGVTAPTADLTFSYRGSENTIAAISCPADVIAAQYWNGTNWNAPALNPGSACITSGVGTTQASGIAAFTTTSSQPYILVKKTNILPVELLSFTAVCHAERSEVSLTWQTATEINNNFFTIERSTDAINYTTIGTVQGAGNSSIVHNYEFVDTDLPSQYSIPNTQIYYRLSQTDFNGQSKTFSSIVVSCSGNSGFSVTVNPNPVSDGNIYVSVNGTANGNILVVLTDVLGRELYSKIIIEQSGGYFFSINMKDKLATGIYFVTASNKNEIFSKKIVVR